MRRETSCFFSGHRVLPNSKLYDINRYLRAEILKKINDGITDFIVGGAMGFDMLAAEAVIEMRNYYPIKLHLYAPCRNHNNRWNRCNIERYENIFSKADSSRLVTDAEYSAECMRARNLAMVTDAEYGIIYMTYYKSGVSQTRSFAKKLGCKTVNIAELIQ